MFGTLVRRELLDHLLRWRFLLVFLICSAVFVFSAITFVPAHKRALEEKLSSYTGGPSRAGLQQSVRNLVSKPVGTARRPLGIEFAVNADSRYLPVYLGIQANGRMTTYTTALGTDNYLLSRFEDVDWVFIVSFVLTFAVIVLCYDSVSSEIEDGTLKIVLSNSVSRALILWSKFAGAFCVLLVPLLTGCIISLLIVLNSGMVAFHKGLVLQVGSVFLLSAFYLAVVTWICIFVSAWLGRSSTSLVVLLVFYVLSALVIPGLAGTLGAKLVRVDSPQEVQAKEVAIQGLPAVLFLSGVHASRDTVDLSKMTAEEKQKYNEEQDRVRADRQRQISLYRADLERKRVAQLGLAMRMAMLSPNGLYKYTAAALAGSGVYRYRRLTAQLNGFVISWRDFLISQDRLDPKSKNSTDFENSRSFSSTVMIPDDRLPVFEERLPSYREILGDALIPGSTLLGISVIVFFCAFLVFARKPIH